VVDRAQGEPVDRAQASPLTTAAMPSGVDVGKMWAAWMGARSRSEQIAQRLR